MPQNCGVLKKPKTYLNFGNIFTGNMVKPPLRGSENVLINLQNREIGNIPPHNGTIPGCNICAFLTKLGHVIC